MSSRRDRIRAKIAGQIKIDETIGWTDPDGIFTPCHIWQGGDSGTSGRGKGYPRMWLECQMVATHRVVYINEHGFVPGKMQIDHRCRNRRCVNIVHLEIVTHKENQKRRAQAQRFPAEVSP